MSEPVPVNCGNPDCGVRLADDLHSPDYHQAPCPSCGSTVRRMQVALQATSTSEASLSGFHSRPGYTKHGGHLAEFYSRVESSKLYGWVRRSRLIDRGGNRYSEKVVAPDGTVVHEANESLTEHWGHGSAKMTKH